MCVFPYEDSLDIRGPPKPSTTGRWFVQIYTLFYNENIYNIAPFTQCYFT
jgi:hypothetical protein